MSRRLSLALLALLAGCDYLFPMQQQSLPDGGSGDGGVPALNGSLCALGDLRDYRSCQVLSGAAAGAFRVSVEETRDSVLSDVGSTFHLPLSRTDLASITLSASDSSGAYATTLVPLTITALNGSVALPLIDASRLGTAELSVGAPGDITHGSLLAWAVTATASGAASVSGVVASASAIGVGPAYDGASADQLLFSGATGAHGAIALFDLSSTSTLTLRLQPPAGLVANQFIVPIRANAVTMTTLVLAP